MTQDFTLEAAPDGRRYSAMQDGREIGFVEAEPIGPVGMRIRHTEVAPSHEGRGIAGALTRFTLDSARQQKRWVIPLCPYAAKYIERHPEYADLVRT